MDISKYTLEDWLLWGVLPEDLKIENEDLSYTEYPERGVETKGTYSLGYMDWYNGAIQSDEVDSLYDKNELGITSYIAITSLQSLAYLKMLTRSYLKNI